MNRTFHPFLHHPHSDGLLRLIPNSTLHAFRFLKTQAREKDILCLGMVEHGR